MGLHSPFDRHFFVLGGATKQDGGSLKLSKGQFGIFDSKKVSKEGLKAVNSFAGVAKDDSRYKLKLGTPDLAAGRSQTNKSYESPEFAIEDVKDVKVYSPSQKDKTVDEVIIGYNGIDPSTSLSFEKGETQKIFIELRGEAIGLLGYPSGVVNMEFYLSADDCPPMIDQDQSCEDCDPCADENCLPIVLKTIEQMKSHTLRGMVPLTDFVDIYPIHQCDNEPTPTTTAANFFCIDVCDTGDSNALALVQAQYPDYVVERENRVDSVSSYKIVVPEADGAPDDYVQTPASVLKGCEGCPTGYTEVEGGILYSVCLEDDGTDESATVEGVAGGVAGTGKLNGRDKGVGFYSVVTDDALTDAEIETFVTANPTAVLTEVGEVSSFCDPDSTTDIPWVACGSCELTTEEYCIILPDDECGNDRLEELQGAYPNLTIEIALDEADQPIKGGCQTKYVTTRPTNVVCPECDDIFVDTFSSTAPTPYLDRKWKKSSELYGEVDNCLCGIRLKGKTLEINAEDCLRDLLGFSDSSVQIQASAGFVTEIREGIGMIEDKQVNVEYLSRFTPRTNMGGEFYQYEEQSRVHFYGENRYAGAGMGAINRFFKGQETVLDPTKQYVDYIVTIKRSTHSQSFSGKLGEYTNYHIVVELGRHQAVEALVNALGGAAGVGAVSA